MRIRLGALRRTLSGRGTDMLALVLIVVAGLGAALYIVSQQRTTLPEWIPIFGDERFHLDAELSTAQSVTPGQGQPVLIAGVEAGLIDSVSLEDGHAVVGMDIEPAYAPVIRADASVLLRPKTALNDMAIEIQPGTGPRPIAEGATIPLQRSHANVNPDEFLARLDGDTRAYLKLLLQGGAEGLAGRSRELSSGLRRLQPFSRYVAELNGAIARRREALSRAVHAFRALASELGRHDAEITDFVAASSSALGGFADRQANIQAALRELPSTLHTTRDALDASGALATELAPTLTELTPQAEALGPALEASRRLFDETAEPIKRQIRPFSRSVQPTLRPLARGSAPFADTVERFGRALGNLNYGFNELAFEPRSRPGYLFYLPWLNHDLNATYTFQDGAGPVRRGMVLLSCNIANLADGAARTRPTLRTLQLATRTLTDESIDTAGGC